MADINEDAGTELPSQGEPVNGRADSSSNSCHSGSATGSHDLIAELRRTIDDTRLPANIRAQICAQLPSPEEQERLYREMQTDGGVSDEELMALLAIKGEPLQ